MGRIAGQCCGRNAIGLALFAVFAVAMLGAPPAHADTLPLEVSEYTRDFEVPSGVAEQRLETQDRGTESGIVEGLERRLGDRFAGIWFDNDAGEFVVPLTADGGRAAVDAELTKAQLGAGFRVVPVRSGWAELEAAQQRVDRALLPLIEDNLVQTSLDPEANAVIVDAAEGVDKAGEAQLRAVAAGEKVEVQIRQSNTGHFASEQTACNTQYHVCDRAMRGGVAISLPAAPCCVLKCTAGFKAIGNTTGNRYVLTAGHCTDGTSNWKSWDSTTAAHPLGFVEQEIQNANGDYSKINANGTWWDEGPWPSQVAYWGVDNARPINVEGSSFSGQWVCFAGAVSGASEKPCGTVTALNKTVNQPQGVQYHNTEFQEVCIEGGDSGAPVFAGNTALGILTADNTGVNGENPAHCHQKGYYKEITEVTAALGVTVGTLLPQVTVQATALNGNPGWATIAGQVKSPNGVTVTNKTVEIKLFKWEGNSWVQKTTPPLKATVTNGSYELKNWNGVGPGSWLAKVVFPAQAPFGESTSNEAKEGSFTVKDGYQLVNAYSGKCLDVDSGGTANGVNLQQWSCTNPATSNNQVFNLEPLAGSNNFQLVARVSDRCADLISKGTVNGTWLQQWDCNGEAQQRWETGQINASNGQQYTQFKTKNTSPGKCMEISGPNLSDGAKAQIWDCLGASQFNQMWTMKSVDAGPVATQTTAVVTQALNGEPGWATVEGEVKAGAYSINGQYVNVNFYKKVSGSWTYIGTSQPTLSNNHFAVNNYVVGVGEWKAQAVFNQQGALGASSSGEPQFTINKGYRLFNQTTGKCLDVENWGTANGVNLDQWDCLNPVSAHLNQVFTLVPRGGGYYQLVAKHSGRCLDVINASTANGAWTQQWDCLGDGQFNQIWEAVPMPGGYVEFKNKNSGKCLEIGNGSPNNGAKAQQWDCYGYGHQQWGFQSVTW